MIAAIPLLLILFLTPAIAQRPAVALQPQARQRAVDTAKPAAQSPNPVVESVDETPVVTHHEITVNGKTLRYTATAAQMPIRNSNGEVEAHVFHTAYVLGGTTDYSKRPLTFCYNGGPGTASMFVHMGAMGPRRVQMLDNGDLPPAPYKLVDNENTWLDVTDLVFIDPVGTGYSRARTIEAARRFNGVAGDIESVSEFIRSYLKRNQRFGSPLFLAGESYGTFRSAGVAGHLINQGIPLNGILLISAIFNYQTYRFDWANDTPYPLYLPTYTANAFANKKLPPDLQKDLKATLKEVETWALNEYTVALAKGDRLTPAERKETIAKLARYTGLDPKYIDANNLRFSETKFRRELLRNEGLTIGRLDGRLTGPSPLDSGENAEGDPSGNAINPPFRVAIETYLRGELGYKTDLMYGGGILPWDWGTSNRYTDVSYLFRNAFYKNPYMKVLVLAGYYDLATPYFAAEYSLNHMGLRPAIHKNISWQFYHAGHMLYTDKVAHAKMKQDITEFIRGALPR